VDASSAILLQKADLFALLLNAWQVVMTPSVFREITKSGYPGAAYFNSLSEITLQEPGPHSHPLFSLKSFASLGRGEKDTIQSFCNLYGRNFKETGAFILVDDARAAKFCQAQQIPFINALLIPKIFWYSGLMKQKDYLNTTACLCNIGRYSQKIIEMAQKFSRDDLAYFTGKDSHGC